LQEYDIDDDVLYQDRHEPLLLDDLLIHGSPELGFDTKILESE